MFTSSQTHIFSSSFTSSHPRDLYLIGLCYVWYVSVYMFALYTNHNIVFFTKLHNHDWFPGMAAMIRRLTPVRWASLKTSRCRAVVFFSGGSGWMTVDMDLLCKKCRKMLEHLRTKNPVICCFLVSSIVTENLMINRWDFIEFPTCGKDSMAKTKISREMFLVKQPWRWRMTYWMPYR